MLMTKNLNWFLKVLNQMFGPETNGDKEQNTVLSRIRDTELPNSNRQVKKKTKSETIFLYTNFNNQYQAYSEISTVWLISHIYFQLELSHFCDELLAQAHIALKNVHTNNACLHHQVPPWAKSTHTWGQNSQQKHSPKSPKRNTCMYNVKHI